VRLATNICALGIMLLTVAGCGPATPPSDASIIARFNAHRTEFGQLLEMFDHDGINGRLGCADSLDDARGPQPISPQRRAEYVKIFKTIGCDGAVYYWPGAKPKPNSQCGRLGCCSQAKISRSCCFQANSQHQLWKQPMAIAGHRWITNVEQSSCIATSTGLGI
jgi:hypothetical protein